jgi:hypothetical protein
MTRTIASRAKAEREKTTVSGLLIHYLSKAGKGLFLL